MQRMTADQRAAAAIDSMPPRARQGRSSAADGALIDGRAFLKLISTPQYIARPTIQRGQTVAMTGRTNHGKTSIAHVHIVGTLTGSKIGPITFKQGNVLLLVGENPGNSALQFKAACRRYGVKDDDLKALTVRPAPGRLADIAAKLPATIGTDFSLVVIDTSTAFFSYTDENDNLQLHQHAQDAAELTKLPGNPAVLILCHPVKGAAQDNLQPRGGGAFLNAIDANLTVWNDGECVTLHHTKMRGPTFEPITFAFQPQDVGLKDDGGAALVPLVAVPLSDDDEAKLGRKRQQEQNRLLYAMLAHPSESIAGLAQACGWKHSTGTPAKSKVERMLDDLSKDKLVRRYRGRYVLTTLGRKEAEKMG